MGGIDPFRAGANALNVPPGKYVARLKLKEIDGDPHKRRSMWLNSMQREEPYLGLTCISKRVKAREWSNPQFAQVLHGCRQLVS